MPFVCGRIRMSSICILTCKRQLNFPPSPSGRGEIISRRASAQRKHDHLTVRPTRTPVPTCSNSGRGYHCAGGS